MCLLVIGFLYSKFVYYQPEDRYRMKNPRSFSWQLTLYNCLPWKQFYHINIFLFTIYYFTSTSHKTRSDGSSATQSETRIKFREHISVEQLWRLLRIPVYSWKRSSGRPKTGHYARLPRCMPTDWTCIYTDI